MALLTTSQLNDNGQDLSKAFILGRTDNTSSFYVWKFSNFNLKLQDSFIQVSPVKKKKKWPTKHQSPNHEKIDDPRCTVTLFSDFLRHFVVGKNNGGRASFQAKRAQQVSCLSIIGASLSEPHSYVLTWTFVIGDIYKSSVRPLGFVPATIQTKIPRKSRTSTLPSFGFE